MNSLLLRSRASRHGVDPQSFSKLINFCNLKVCRTLRNFQTKRSDSSLLRHFPSLGSTKRFETFSNCRTKTSAPVFPFQHIALPCTSLQPNYSFPLQYHHTQSRNLSAPQAHTNFTSVGNNKDGGEDSNKNKNNNNNKTGGIKDREIKRSKNAEIAKLLWPYVWPHNRRKQMRVVAALSSLVISKLAIVKAPLLLGSIANSVANKSTKSTAGAVAAFGLCRISASFFQELRSALFAEVSHSASREIACKTFMHLHELDLDHLLSHKAGSLSVLISQGTKGVTQLLNTVMFQVIPTVLELSLVLGLLSSKLGPSVAVTSAMTVFGYGVFTAKVTKKRINHRKAMNKAEREVSGLLLDTLTNTETVRHNTNEYYEYERFRDQERAFEHTSVIVQRSLGALNFGQQFIFNLGLLAAIGLTATSVKLPSAGDIILASNILYQLATPLNFFGTVWRQITLGLIDVEKIYDLLQTKPKCVNLPDAKHYKEGLGEVEIENISFQYEDLKSLIYKGLSVHIPAGQKVAIVGPSGGGKSTLLKLICRFYDPTSGRILIDGQDIKHLNMRSFRQRISVLPQEVVLFNESILHNIRYGRPQASFEEVVQAAKVAKIHDTIMSFPDNYNTKVGERGLKLSGGEKQRIGIARCALRRPVLFLFDEATSSLDANTERDILSNIKSAFGSCTRIVIAHRLSTVTDACKVLYLDKGSVVESGTFDELMAIPNGKFAAMWEKQALGLSFS